MPFAPRARPARPVCADESKRLISYRYMTLRASTAAGTLGTGLLQTFVFARALTPERFSLFIFLGALGYMLVHGRCRHGEGAVCRFAPALLGQSAAAPRLPAKRPRCSFCIAALPRWHR